MKTEYMSEDGVIVDTAPPASVASYRYGPAPNRREVTYEALSVVCVKCGYKRIVKPKDAEGREAENA